MAWLGYVPWLGFLGDMPSLSLYAFVEAWLVGGFGG
jgi:hypothetical protein